MCKKKLVCNCNFQTSYTAEKVWQTHTSSSNDANMTNQNCFAEQFRGWWECATSDPFQYRANGRHPAHNHGRPCLCQGWWLPHNRACALHGLSQKWGNYPNLMVHHKFPHYNSHFGGKTPTVDNHQHLSHQGPPVLCCWMSIPVVCTWS